MSYAFKPSRQRLKQMVLERLSRHEQLIVVLRYYEQMSILEISLVLEMPRQEVSQALDDIRSQLREWLQAA